MIVDDQQETKWVDGQTVLKIMRNSSTRVRSECTTCTWTCWFADPLTSTLGQTKFIIGISLVQVCRNCATMLQCECYNNYKRKKREREKVCFWPFLFLVALWFCLRGRESRLWGEWSSDYDFVCFQTKWGLSAYVIVHTMLPPSPVILWTELGGKPKWLPLSFGNHDEMRTTPLASIPLSHIREVPRLADYEYEYVWVSRILTRWLSVPRRTYWQNEYEYEYNVVGRVNLAAPRPLRPSQGPEATQPYSSSTCVQDHSRSLRIHFTAEFAPFFHSRKVNS